MGVNTEELNQGASELETPTPESQPEAAIPPETGAPQAPSEGGTRLKDKPLTQERFNEVWKQSKTSEQRIRLLEAELEEAKARREPAYQPPTPTPGKPEFKVPRHLEAFAKEPGFPPLMDAVSEYVRHVLKTEIEPRFKTHEEKLSKWELSQVQAEQAQVESGYRRQFESVVGEVQKELELDKQFDEMQVESLIMRAGKTLVPWLNSPQAQNMSPARLDLEFRQNLRTALEGVVAALPPRKVTPRSNPPGTPAVATTPGAAPIAEEDQNLAKLARGEITEREAIAHVKKSILGKGKKG